MIARCVNRFDVAASVIFAREQGLEIAVRCGSHHAAGIAACDDGLMIDLSLMRSVTVDPEARRVRVAGGALLGDMDAATQEHGLATTAGTVCLAPGLMEVIKPGGARTDGSTEEVPR